MNDAWLQDCIKYFIRDKNHEVTDRHILEFVEGQWQLSDLREINNVNGCLPRNLIQQVHTVLTGTYILQVDKMYDIANSKYKQLCEIRKINNENLIVPEEEKPAEWEPKARRMIQLYLTDGVQDITAIEYKPLKQMTNMLLPGYKVMIIGPINCRRGIILLEDGKYKEIGGEVESLLKSNALENVLARALGEPENSDPYNDNGLSRPVNQNVHNASPKSNDNINSNDNLFDDDFEETVDLEAVTAIERRNQEIKTIENSFGSVYNQKQIRETKETMEEFLEDIDFDPVENCKQNKNLSKDEIKAYSSPKFGSNLATHDTSKKIKTNMETLTKQNEKFMASISSTTKQAATINVLSDILSKPIIGKIHKIVRAQVKSHSALKKQDKHWTVTALIADHTSSIEVCFDSEILEKYIGFSVQEFSQKKKLAKSDPQVNNELRLKLRRAQHQIQNLNALLELELIQGYSTSVIVSESFSAKTILFGSIVHEIRKLITKTATVSLRSLDCFYRSQISP
ncbi:Protein RMI1-like protein [Camponotus floridanus]|uniref:RecQ-mediated genome instability protein 1 n=1 Tax=Camponotus floridanus TaxID=104421 RepID=E2ABX9_CAMFO|nr:Protein RMI1-like protein [Camponotus floridanus]